MPRYAFKLRIKADAIEEYEREHQHVWPELLAKLKQVGISDYSIFRRGQELVLKIEFVHYVADNAGEQLTLRDGKEFVIVFPGLGCAHGW